jgi:hypothetical protein
MKITLSRVLLIAILTTSTLLTLTTPSVEAGAPARTPTPTATPDCGPNEERGPDGNCRPIRRECPAGTIDLNGNGYDDGDCENLDVFTRPTNCLPSMAGPTLAIEGAVECALPWAIYGQPLRLMVSVGCLDVRRTQYPRVMVGVPVEFDVRRIIPPSQLANVPFGGPGSYRVSSSQAWTTEGLYLHERYGAASTDSLGRPAFDTRVVLSGDPYRFPSLNNVRAYLKFTLDPNSFVWNTADLPEISSGLQDPVKLIYPRSSFPLPGEAELLSPFGPSRQGRNDLPAFRLSVRAEWQLRLVVEWDNYYVNGSRQYTRGIHERFDLPIARPFTSARVWDSRQSAQGVGIDYCNATWGYVPVPVIEAQTVLKP